MRDPAKFSCAAARVFGPVRRSAYWLLSLETVCGRRRVWKVLVAGRVRRYVTATFRGPVVKVNSMSFLVCELHGAVRS